MLTHRTSAVMVSKETRKVFKKENEVYTLQSNNYPNVLLYVLCKWVKIVKEGPTDTIFDKGEMKETALNAEAEEQILLPVFPSADDFVEENIATMHAAGVTVDDDNDPAPENIPTTQTEGDEVKYDNWGYKGICYHWNKGCYNTSPLINVQYASCEQQSMMSCGS
eukprot:7346644-Ditylum_brightwellii.AAC.1